MAVLNAVRSGTVTLGAGVASVTATITSVTPGKAYLRFFTRVDDQSPEFSDISGELTNATTLTFARVTALASPAVVITYFVADFTSGVSVQRGSFSFAGVASLDTTITAVDLSKAFPLISFQCSGANYDANDFLKAEFTSTTNLRVTANAVGGATHVVKWQVISVDVGGSVQTGTCSLATGDGSKTAAIPAFVTLTRSFVEYSYTADSGTATDIGQKMLRGVLTDGNTLTFDRDNTGVNIDVRWFVIELNDGTTVQRGSAAFGAAVTQVDTGITAVTLAKAMPALGSMCFRGGKSPYNAADNPGVATATAELTSTTNLRLTRAVTGSATADMAWQVIQYTTSTFPGGYVQARAGLACSGSVLSGLFPRILTVTIGGVTRTIDKAWSVDEHLDIANPNRLNFQTMPGYDIAKAQEIVLALGHPTNRLFAGHISNTKFKFLGFEASAELDYGAVAVDYSWQLNTKDLVFGSYLNVGVSTIVGDILARCTEGGFKPGMIPQSLGNLTIKFLGDLVTVALAKVAAAANARCVLSYNKYVDVVTQVTDGNPLTIGDATVSAFSLAYDDALPQLRNRIPGAGGGGTTTALVPAGATVIPVSELGWYTGGSTVLADTRIITFTGMSAGAGPGSLTGCTGILDDIPQGQAIRVYELTSDAPAQTAMAATLGGGVSGAVSAFLDNGQLSRAEVLGRIANDLLNFKNGLQSLVGTVVNDQYKVGKTITLSITTPKAITGSFVIQSQSITPYKDAIPEADGTIVVQRQIKAVGYVKYLITLF